MFTPPDENRLARSRVLATRRVRGPWAWLLLGAALGCRPQVSVEGEGASTSDGGSDDSGTGREPEPDPPPPPDVLPDCGDDGPIELIELAEGSEVRWRTFRDRLLVEVMDFDQVEDGWLAQTHLVDACGADSTILLEPRTLADEPYEGTYAPAGSHLVRCGSQGRIDLVEIEGTEVDLRPLLATSTGCQVFPVGNGLGAVDPIARELWFHPDPNDPDEAAYRLADNIHLPEYQICARQELVDCWARADFARTVIVGERLLVAVEPEFGWQEGIMHRFDPTTGDLPVVVDRARQIELMEDGVHALMLGQVSGAEPSSSDVFVYDSSGGTITPLGSGGGGSTGGMWVNPTINRVEAQTLDLVHVPTGRTYTVSPAAHWHLRPSTPDTLILLEDDGNHQPIALHVEDVDTGERRAIVELADAERDWAWVDRVHRVAFAADDRTVRPFDGSEPIVAAAVVADDFERPLGTVVLELDDLGNEPPIVVYDPTGRHAWELEFEGPAKISQREHGRVTILDLAPREGLQVLLRRDL